MFAQKDTPAQIEAGIKWINFEDLTPGVGQFNFVRQKADGFPVGFPEPELFVGADRRQDQPAPRLRPRRSTCRTTQSFINANEPGDGEPSDAQAVYKSLDPVMLAVLTEPNANIPALLKSAAANVNTILANSRGITAETTGPFGRLID